MVDPDEPELTEPSMLEEPELTEPSMLEEPEPTARDDAASTDETGDAPSERGPEERPAPGDKRRQDAIFGDVLPDATGDERGDAWGDVDRSRDDDLLGDIPPHHT